MVKNCAKLLPLVLLFAAFGSHAGLGKTIRHNPKKTAAVAAGTLATAGIAYHYKASIAGGAGLVLKAAGNNPKSTTAIVASLAVAGTYAAYKMWWAKKSDEQTQSEEVQ